MDAILGHFGKLPKGSYPQKVKASGCCAPVWECDLNGKRIEQPELTEAIA